jgi:hypothetical protein
MCRFEQTRFAAAVTTENDIVKRERPEASLSQIPKVVNL